MIITQGDELTLTFTCKDQDLTGHNLTGATLTTIFPRGDGTDLSVANAAHTIDADQATNPGKFTLDITAANSALLKVGEKQNVIVKVVQSGDTIHFHGTGILTVKKGTFAR